MRASVAERPHEEHTVKNFTTRLLSEQSWGTFAPSPTMRHQDTLAVKVTFTVEGTGYLRQGAQVTGLALDLLPWGFQGWVEVVLTIENDATELLGKLLGADLISVTLEVKGVLNQVESPWTLRVTGLGTERQLLETPLAMESGRKVLTRYLRLHFADPAQVLWRQHYPLKIGVDTTLKEVIEGQPAQGVTLDFDWPLLEESRRLVCLPLGVAPHVSSFYDYLMWLVEGEQGCFSWHHSDGHYRLGERRKAGSTAQTLPHDCVEHAQMQLGALPRATPTLVSVYTGPTARKSVENAEAATGIRKDVLCFSRTDAELDAISTPEKKRLNVAKDVISLSLTRFSGNDFSPGAQIKLKYEPWSLMPRLGDQELRVVSLHLGLEGLDTRLPPSENAPESEFRLELNLTLERKGEQVVRVPTFVPPVWPLQIEGLVEAPGATSPDEPYMVILDEETSRTYYRVFIPSFNVRLLVPADEGVANSHIYFPLAQGQRVVLEVFYDRLWIRHLLNWGHQIPLPLETQGQQLRFGIGENSNTTVKQVYDGPDPLFTVVRQHLADTIRIELTEGKLLLQVKEDASKSSAQETFSVKPKQEASQAQVESKGGGGIGEAGAQFGSNKADLEAGMSAASSEAEATVQEKQAALEAKTGEASAELSAASSELGGKTAALEQEAAAASAALKKALKG